MTTASSGGAEFGTCEMLRSLTEQGHDAVLITNQPQLAPPPVMTRTIELGAKLSSQSWRRLVVHSFPLFAHLLWALRSEEPYDVLLVPFKKEQLLCSCLPRSLRGTLVWAEWGPVPRALRRGIPNVLYRLASRRAALVLAVSESTALSAAHAGVDAAKIHVVPNALPVGEIQFRPDGRRQLRKALGIGPSDFVVGTIARLHRDKRHDVLIDAMAALPEHCHLLIAGEGESEGELREHAAALGARAHFLRSPSGETADVLSACDVVVFCPAAHEGASRAVVLAMLASRPCVATASSGAGLLRGSTAGSVLSKPNDVPELTRTLREYLSDPERRATEGAEGRRLAVSAADPWKVATLIESLLVEVQHA